MRAGGLAGFASSIEAALGALSGCPDCARAWSLVTSSGQVGGDVDVTFDDFGDAEAERRKQRHDAHIPEGSERYGETERQPNDDSDGGAGHLNAHFLAW